MSDLCKETFFAYAACSERAAEDPKAFDTAFRQMMDTDGLHTRAQIETAQQMLGQGEACTSESPETSQDCRIVAAIVLKNAIG